LLLGNADLEYLLGFSPGGGAAQCGQAKGYPIGILDLSGAVNLGQSEERFDLIGADRQTNLVQTKPGSGLELVLQVEGELTANRL
jgi:hypothetical protein